MTTLTWKRGSTFQMALSVTSGTVLGTEEVRCALKVMLGGGAPTGEELMAFSSSFVEEAGSEPAHWLFEGTPAQSLTLPIGNLVADARVELTDGVFISDPVVIQHVKTVTPE